MHGLQQNSCPSSSLLGDRASAAGVLLQDAQTAEVQAYFSQWGPVNSCQLAHNNSALIALISRQGPLQACGSSLTHVLLLAVIAYTLPAATLHHTSYAHDFQSPAHCCGQNLSVCFDASRIITLAC